jgi:hypothetical protein
LKFVFLQVKTSKNISFISKNNFLFLDTAKTLTGFVIRGEASEIHIQYDTLSIKNINYIENVCPVFLILFS